MATPDELEYPKPKRAKRVKVLPGQIDMLDETRSVPPAPTPAVKRRERTWPARGVHGAICTILKAHGPKTSDELRLLIEGLKGQSYSETAVREGIANLVDAGYLEVAGTVRCERYGKASLYRRRIIATNPTER